MLTCSVYFPPSQSYAGKYIPAIGYKIHMANKNNPKVSINLKGLAIGDGLCDPEHVSFLAKNSALNLALSLVTLIKEYIHLSMRLFYGYSMRLFRGYTLN